MYRFLPSLEFPPIEENPEPLDISEETSNSLHTPETKTEATTDEPEKSSKRKRKDKEKGKEKKKRKKQKDEEKKKKAYERKNIRKILGGKLTRKIMLS